MNFSELVASFVSFSERKSVDIILIIGSKIPETGKENAGYKSYPFLSITIVYKYLIGVRK